VGIISTPVIDPSTNTLYVVARTYENSVQIYRLHALDILNQGAEKLGGPIQIAARYPGSGVPNDGAGHVLFFAAKENQRAAVTLVNHSVLYLAFASLEDNPPITVGYWRIARLIYSSSPPTMIPPTAGKAVSGFHLAK
jgi:hypothetical protein